MLVIRRQVDRRRAYTVMMLPGEPPRVFPTSDHEHARILQIFLQDRPYEGVENDFTAFGLHPQPAQPPGAWSQPASASPPSGGASTPSSRKTAHTGSECPG